MTHHSSRHYRVSLLEGCDVKVAILGPPNTGKSTLFNVLTGGNVLVANWPGVTVDVEIGKIKTGAGTTCIADLPGVYGLYPTTMEERVAEAFILDNKPDWVMVLIDATTPEKSLSLLVQALEAFGAKVIGVMTKKALMHGMGIHFDVEGLKRDLSIEIVETSVLEGIGVSELKSIVSRKPRSGDKRYLEISYGSLEAYIEKIAGMAEVSRFSIERGVSSRYIAVSLLLGDPVVSAYFTSELLEAVSDLRAEAEKSLSIDLRHAIFERRYQFVEEIASRHIVRTGKSKAMESIDRVLTHPIIGPLASILLVVTVFLAVFSVNTGFPLNILLSYTGHDNLASLVEEYSFTSLLGEVFDKLSSLTADTIGGTLGDLIGNGVIGGVGAVLSFVPLVMMVYIFLGILEDTGIIARIASSLHPIMEPFGLTGRSVFPFFISLGCNVPGVYATRAASFEERIKSLWSVPFIPCQARLVVMLAFADAFFKNPAAKAFAVLGLYTAGILAALFTSIVASIIFKHKLGIERRIPLVLELPYIHRPSWRVVYWITRDNTWHFIKKAGTIIFFMSLITWLLLSYGPTGYTDNLEESFGGIIGEKLSFILAPMGIQGGPATILTLGLIVGLVAKEVVLSTVVQATGIGDPIKAVQHLGLTHAQAFGFLLIVTLYFPCIATLAAMYAETRDPRYVLLFGLYSIVLALTAGYLGYYLHTLL